MTEKNTLKKKMRRLSSPYKKSTAYVKYGDTDQEIKSPSTFWRTEIRYFAKYQMAKFQSK